MHIIPDFGWGLCYIVSMSNITPKQLLFCEFYIQTSNGTLAARLAGYKGKDDNVFAAIASQNLRKLKIQAYLKERYADVAMDSNEVLARLAKMARASISDFVDEHGIIDWEKVSKEGYTIKSVTHTKGKSSRVELEGKMRALELIGKAQAMFTEKIEVEGGNKPITVRVEYSDDYTPPPTSDSKGGYRQQRIKQRAGERAEVGEDTPGA